MKKKPKITRQKAIELLLQKEKIFDQHHLMTRLKEEFGLGTNQASLSRDLRKLGVVKKQVGENLVYELPSVDIKKEILKLAVIKLEHNETMIVIKTEAGLADFVGDAVDQLKDESILGSLAGENVVFVIPKSIKEIKKTYISLCQKMSFKEGKS